jgi:hypothetical protein
MPWDSPVFTNLIDDQTQVMLLVGCGIAALVFMGKQISKMGLEEKFSVYL